MSVSSPSYFPPAGAGGQVVGATAGSGATGLRTFLAGANAAKNTQLSDLLVIGDNALAAGTVGAPVTDANLTGLTIIGSQAAQALVNTVADDANARGTSTIIGFNAAKALPCSSSNTIIGSNAANAYNATNLLSPLAESVLIGEGVFSGYVDNGGMDFNDRIVAIGMQAASLSAGNRAVSFRDSVLIGFRACRDAGKNQGTGGVGVERCVVIGSSSGGGIGTNNSASGANDNVFIGYTSGDVGASTRNVYIGTGSTGTGSSQASSDNVGIGSANNATGCVAGLSANTVIGAGAFNLATNNGCILIGAFAGHTTAVGARDFQLLIETQSGTKKTALYGLMASASPGGLVLGNSTEGVNRDVPGFNIVKLIDGSVTGVAPVGGGMFYSAAGRLHWVDSGNVDWALTGTAAGQLASSVVAYTNNAAAAAGTLGNAPAAGNPTKWIPINDNGTIRNIPAW